MFPSIDDLRQKFQEAKYIVDEVTLSQVKGYSTIGYVVEQETSPPDSAAPSNGRVGTP